MTITEEHRIEGYDGRNDYLICCDGGDSIVPWKCTKSLDAKDRTFGQAVIFLKAKGWKLSKEHGSWFHYCPDCCG